MNTNNFLFFWFLLGEVVRDGQASAQGPGRLCEQLGSRINAEVYFLRGNGTESLLFH